MLTFVIAFTLTFVVTWLYAGAFEYWMHRWPMHHTIPVKLGPLNFKITAPAIRHAGKHHVQRKAPNSFYIKEGEEAPDAHYRFGLSSAIPWLWVCHVPIYLPLGYGFGWLLGFNAGLAVGLGSATSAGLFLTAYEIVHEAMHNPRYAWLYRFRWFQFLCEYHRTHHYKASCNFSVVGALLFGIYDRIWESFSSEELPLEGSAPSQTPKMATLTGVASVYPWLPRLLRVKV